MIFRGTDEVWARISGSIQKFVGRWHTPGRLDRSVRFMITSGRPEFRDLVWPLITDENNQKSLPALRAARRFRTSLLGPCAAKDILTLPIEVRKVVVSEIAHRSGMDGLDLATLIAKTDADRELKAAVVGDLAFRRADRHVAEVLTTADDATFDLVYRKGYLEKIDDKSVEEGLAAARARAEKDASSYDQLRAIVYARDGKDHGAELIELIATIQIESNQDAQVGLIYEARKHNEAAVAQGLLRRLRDGRELFYGADNIMAAAKIALEDDALLETVLAPQQRMDSRAETAASILGPVSVGKLIDTMLLNAAEIRKMGRYDKSLSDRYFGLRDRIAHVPGVSLIAAVQERAAGASNEDIRELAGLLCRREEQGDRARPFPRETCSTAVQIAEQWGDRLIASGNSATRSQLAAVAEMIWRFPSVALLPLLKRLLDDELRRYWSFYKQAQAEGWRGEATNEARMHHTNIYQSAFTAIKAPETTALMIEYLSEEHFGETAALVLKVQWIEAHEPKSDRRLLGGVDFAGVEEHRALRASNASQTCREAEAIFLAIEPLIAEGTTEVQKTHAIKLATQALCLPHGERAETIQALLSIAPQTTRVKLLLNLVLSGEIIPFDAVQSGIDEVFEDAKKQSWILQEGWQLKTWLLLLPFTNRPARLADAVLAFPPPQREPRFLEEMIRAAGSSGAPEIEEALFKLAESNAAFYANYAWQGAVLGRGTLSSGRRYLDLILEEKIDGRGGRHVAREIGSLLKAHPQLRDYAYSLLSAGISSKDGAAGRGGCNIGDADVLPLLVDLETRLKRPLISWYAIQGAVTEHVPSEHWRGAFDVVPVAATELRKKCWP